MKDKNYDAIGGSTFKSMVKKKRKTAKKLLNSEAYPRQKQRQNYRKQYLRREEREEMYLIIFKNV